jgi:hypothetical protein
MGRRSAKSGGSESWLPALAAQVEQLGARLGEIISEQVRRHVERSIDVGALSQQLLASAAGKRGRRGAAERALCKVVGCGSPVLAKGFCRSHYYRERYRLQKAEASAARGKRKGRGVPRARKPEPTAQTTPG